MASPSFLEADDCHQAAAYSRKQKSLGLLCTNFVSLYDREDVETISLDDAAKQLGVERRRIYDIVNVMESVGVLTRKAKNRYSWIGFLGIPKALEELKAEALQEISRHHADDHCELVAEDEEDDKSIDQDEDKLSAVLYKARSVADNRKEKSLGQLTRNFVKLFLTTDVDIVSLDEAATLLLGDCHDPAQMKNTNAAKVRRLYDIANVLSSMNIIEKTQQAVTKKPAFRWLGSQGKREVGVTVAIAPPTVTQLKKRAFGSEITNVDFKKGRMAYSAVKKANKMQVSSEDLKACNLAAHKQLQSAGDYVFGPFQPVGVSKGVSSVVDRGGSRIKDWESFASSFRPQYQNQALSDLFVHYVEAWNSWFAEITQGTGSLKQTYKPLTSIYRSC